MRLLTTFKRSSGPICADTSTGAAGRRLAHWPSDGLFSEPWWLTTANVFTSSSLIANPCSRASFVIAPIPDMRIEADTNWGQVVVPFLTVWRFPDFSVGWSASTAEFPEAPPRRRLQRFSNRRSRAPL